jgi:hypothetical protein
MAKEELVQGLRNAIERGSSLQSAVQSFINAGYNSAEVNEAARMVNLGAINRISQPIQVQKSNNLPSNLMEGSSLKSNNLPDVPNPPTPNNQQNSFQKLPTQQPILDNNQQNQTPAKKKVPGYVIVLILVFLILVFGALLFSFFGETLLNMLFK